MVESFIWHITPPHLLDTLCTNVLVFECVFILQRILHQTLHRSNRLQWPEIFSRKSPGRTQLSGPVNKLVVSSLWTNSCDQLYCSSLGGHCCMYMSEWMNGKSAPLLGETSPVKPVANSFFSTLFELELYLSFTQTASLQSASLECCANESEAAHVLWWMREFVQHTTVGVLQAHRIPGYCCLPCTLDCLITIRSNCQVYFFIRICVPMWPWPQWPETML